MIIVLKNELGRFEVGGGKHPKARLQEITGLGIPAKENKTIVFEGQPGQTLKQSRDLERTITMSFDFFGDERTVRELYKIIYEPVTIYFYLSNGEQRKIVGHCTKNTDIKNIIYHQWQSIALQFVCYDPYFYDFYDASQAISENFDQWPNNITDGVWDIVIPSIATLRSNNSSVYVNGDVKVYPVITIQALQKNEQPIALINNTTGKRITLNYNISEGEVVTVNLPTRVIESNINGNITNCISDDTVLGDFYLLRGSNDIAVATTGNIFVVVRFSNKYMSVVI